ncbi:MAG: hypothetical protein WD847_14255 [Pirellulales bacterium]
MGLASLQSPAAAHGLWHISDVLEELLGELLAERCFASSAADSPNELAPLEECGAGVGLGSMAEVIG